MSLARAALLLSGVGAIAGCGAGPSPEDLGDAAFAKGNWAAAVAEYSRAGTGSQVMAKRAEANLAANQLVEASVSWLALSRDPDRTGEAAAGLVRTAQAAERSGHAAALVMSIAGLRAVAPTWPVGRLALAVDLTEDATPDEVLMMVPAKLSAGATGMAADDLLLRLARVERDQRRCHLAEPLLAALTRRAQPPVSDEAAGELAGCELQAGLAALNDGDLLTAYGKFEAAARRDGMGTNGRRALIGLGDIHMQQGDPIAATLAWRAVASAIVSPDSVTALALERLRTALPSLDLEYPDSPR
jgi:hypothetical protein